MDDNQFKQLVDRLERAIVQYSEWSASETRLTNEQIAELSKHTKQIAQQVDRLVDRPIFINVKSQKGRDGRDGRDGTGGPPGNNGGQLPGGGGSGNARFWEAYAVRYFAGTFTGVAAILMLYGVVWSGSDAHPEMAQLFELFKSLITDESSTVTLVLLIGLGFAFSYISSAPLYLLHVFRGSFIGTPTRRVTTTGALIYLLIGIILITAIIWTSFPSVHSVSPLYQWLILIPFGFYLAVVLMLFVIAVEPTKREYPKHLGTPVVDYYLSLTALRAAANLEEAAKSATQAKNRRRTQIPEYIESYRHLREHANAYGIVITNILFAVVLSVVSKPPQLVVIVALWVLPAFLAWFTATKLEIGLSRLSNA